MKRLHRTHNDIMSGQLALIRIFLLGLLVALGVVDPVYTGEPPTRSNTIFFNGRDLTGWSTTQPQYWSVKDGIIVGHSHQELASNELLWSTVEVQDFYLALDVKLTPHDRNGGIQFRSRPGANPGLAIGYQADMGQIAEHGNLWGRLFHEGGRGILDWNTHGAEVVKSGDWNRYEILAVGDRIWTAINGKLCVAIKDPEGEPSGKIAFQIHGDPP